MSCSTPIINFVRDYLEKDISRLHMPGHKGVPHLGCEPLDITEIRGADDLTCPQGILLESEENTGSLFGSRHSFYATGGSSQCVKAMLYLALMCAAAPKNRAHILAARNVHKSFIQGCALLDLDVTFLSTQEASLCACPLSPCELEQALASSEERPIGVYITSPDYLGGTLDITALSEVCRRYGVPLLVDNAHGAYLRFLPTPSHPMDLGADLCCDSAHKTLPVLTGGAYLHVSQKASAAYEAYARSALSLFGTSSPSYLILQSLDFCAQALSENYPAQLKICCEELLHLKRTLTDYGLVLWDSEPLKLTVNAAATGTTGWALAELLRQERVECEFADQDFLVCMFSPYNSHRDFQRVCTALQRAPLAAPRLTATHPLLAEECLSIREAFFSKKEELPVENAVGRICAGTAVSCPPAVPIAVCGQKITAEMLSLFTQYGIETIEVVK